LAPPMMQKCNSADRDPDGSMHLIWDKWLSEVSFLLELATTVMTPAAFLLLLRRVEPSFSLRETEWAPSPPSGPPEAPD